MHVCLLICNFKIIASLAAPASASAEPPHSSEFSEIMQMVARGETPPNVRQIDDSPLEPFQNEETKEVSSGKVDEIVAVTEEKAPKEPIIEEVPAAEEKEKIVEVREQI